MVMLVEFNLLSLDVCFRELFSFACYVVGIYVALVWGVIIYLLSIKKIYY